MKFCGFFSILPAILIGLTFSGIEHAVITALHLCVQRHSRYRKARFHGSSLALTFRIPQSSFIIVGWYCDMDVLCAMKDFMVCYSVCINLL